MIQLNVGVHRTFYKMEKKFIAFVIVMLVISSLIIFYPQNSKKLNWDMEKLANEPLKANTKGPIRPNDYFSNIEEPHFTNLPITYLIVNEEECNEKVKNRIHEAFEKIQSETGGYVAFKNLEEETEELEDISVYCEGYNSQELYGSLGEGSASVVIHGDSMPYSYNYDSSLIEYAIINFYGSGLVCNTGYPALEVHEILHALGFDHDYGVNSIMRPEVEGTSKDCSITEMDKEHINCLKYIYSNGVIEGDCSDLSFIDLEFHGITSYECVEGWHLVEGTQWCCPEQDMIVVNNVCVNNG